MAIKFLNIRSRETVIAEDEPQITALWASSDRSPNITQGQDFGWRLAPEVVVEMKRIKQNEDLLLTIAKRYNRPLEDIGEPEILQYISDKTSSANAPVAKEEDYTDEYQAEIKRLELEHEPTVDELMASTQQTVTTTTTESLADMEKRAELEERIAKAKREQAEAAATTTTTTEKPAPTTTTTTTKK